MVGRCGSILSDKQAQERLRHVPARQPKEAGRPVNIDEIKELIRTLDQSSVVELTWEMNGGRLTLRKASAVQPAQEAGRTAAISAQEGAAAARGVSAAEPAESGAAGPAAPAASDNPNLIRVTAPMVGTFYRAPAPDAPPYVEVGDVVEPGDPLCIIEAMKLMNEIEADERGRVQQILVENGQPVEYGQVLFVLERL